MGNQEWKDVVGYEGLYKVSNTGEIKGIRDKKWNGYIFQKLNEKILKQRLNKNGYKQITLKDHSGNLKTLYVHRLVAIAFCEGYAEGSCVNHKNEIKADNNAKNLEWCTKRYNNFYNNKILKSCKPVIQYSLNNEPIKEWVSARDASRSLNIEFKNISACCRNKRNKTGGYKWKFKEVSQCQK